MKELQAKTEAARKQLREEDAKKKSRKETLKILEDGTGEALMLEERARRRNEVKNKTVEPDQVKLALAAQEKKKKSEKK